jgi:RecA/RadA recombinase
MSNKWLSKLTADFGQVASKMPRPTDSVIQLPSPSLNWAIGNGGLIEGKAICFYGGESGGKSLLMQLTLIEIQRKHPDGICILFDAEYSFNPDWFEKLGGDLERLIVRQSNDPVKIFDYIRGEMLELLQDGCPIKSIAIDSVKSIKYPKDDKKSLTDVTMGGSGASFLGPALKHVTPVIRENNVTCILVQQVYEEMDQYKKMRNPYIVPDGRALKHFCDYMAQVDKLETKDNIVESGKDLTGKSAAQIGHKVKVKFKKNRCSAPYRVAQFTLDYEHGIVDRETEIFDLAKSIGVIYHPINPETGKPNNMFWKFAEHGQIKGEESMKDWVVSSKTIQAEIMIACHQHKDAPVQLDATGTVIDELSDIDLDAETNLNIED